jgi:hypothetical protein
MIKPNNGRCLMMCPVCNTYQSDDLPACDHLVIDYTTTPTTYKYKDKEYTEQQFQRILNLKAFW